MSGGDLRAALNDQKLFNGIRTVVIDSVTKAEAMAISYTLKAVTHEKGHHVNSIEGYGFGKGYQYVFDTFSQLFQDLDRHVKAGRNVILVCHECVASVPNPNGEDWIRYEPRLQSPSSGKGSIRHSLKEWVDHLLFIGYDIVTNRDGKAQGSGTRTIYPCEMPTHMAKSRTLEHPIPFEKGSRALWETLFGGE